jgi:hypothetical protein
MPSQFKILPALAALLSVASAQASGSGVTTRYWDCCKASCAWNNLSQLGIQSSVTSCDIHDQPLSTNTDKSGCDNNGPAYMCSSQTPWAVSSTLAYGFAAVSASNPKCCQCYELTFTSTSLATHGKKMIVQATNTGGDVSSTQFDIALPGGGFGIYNGCSNEWGATSSVWGAQYGGTSSNNCNQFPAALQAVCLYRSSLDFTNCNQGCNFRWNWYEGADNPNVNWKEVACPAALTAKSGCVRSGDSPTGPSSVSTWTSGASSPTTSSAPTSTGTSASSSPTTTTTSSGGTIPKYGQCGGQGWTGSGTCASGSTCTYSNQWYSQCL